jgi:hypothetical protein
MAILAGGVFIAQADVEIDFEDPLLGFRGQQALDPFISSGVRFTALPFPNGGSTDEVVGLVFNELNNACVDPANRNVKLGTGRQSTYPNSGIGWDGYPIKAELTTPLQPDSSRGDQVEISVEFQTVTGKEVRLRLYNSSHEMVVEERGKITSNRGDCGKIGGPRGTVRLTAVTQSDVSYAILDVPKNFLGGIAYVIDDFKVRFTRGVRPDAVQESELCGRLEANSSTLPYNIRPAGCQNLERFENLGGGEFKAFVPNMMHTQIMSGRDLCNALVGGCPPCPIAEFICPNYEIIFSDVYAHDLKFTNIFDVTVHDLTGRMIGQGFRELDGSISVQFTLPTINSSNEESGFFVVLQPDAVLPWKFDFWGHAELVVENPDPLVRFDMNNNLRIDTNEFFELMDSWTDGFIPDQLFFQGLDHWTHQMPLASRTSSSSASDATRFELSKLNANLLSFQAVGNNISTTHVQIFNTGGQSVFDQTGNGSRLMWNLRGARGNRVANGIYFYRITSISADGSAVRSEVRKFVVMN